MTLVRIGTSSRVRGDSPRPDEEQRGDRDCQKVEADIRKKKQTRRYENRARENGNRMFGSPDFR